MKITKIMIRKFRAFEDISFSLGKKITIIAGQNGTQKTTVLGLLTQPFSITEKNNPIYDERPLCGGNYKSAFSEKFKLSEFFDFPKEHEWTLFLDTPEQSEFTVESITRDQTSKEIRFWKKGNKSKGSGYLPLPVIFLSLSRLFPIGEDIDLLENEDHFLTPEEQKLYQEWHNKILIIPDTKITKTPILQSTRKNTIGVNTAIYDWKMNSAGQDNLGKILLAIFSFKRLKEKYKDKYTGGILAIDEVDATLFPASQIKLYEALLHFSAKYNIQIFCTTHSLSILHTSASYQNGDIRTIFFTKKDNKIYPEEDLTFNDIQNKLNVILPVKKEKTKKMLFTEDHEAYLFLKAILKRNFSLFKYAKCSLGCGNLRDLVRNKVPGFREQDSIIVLDGDINKDQKSLREIKKYSNILLLPGKESPELLLATFLHEKQERDPLWEKLYPGYTKQFAFKDFSYDDIIKGNGQNNSREISKKWFKNQIEYWGKNGITLINAWIAENKEQVEEFIKKIIGKIQYTGETR